MSRNGVSSAMTCPNVVPSTRTGAPSPNRSSKESPVPRTATYIASWRHGPAISVAPLRLGNDDEPSGCMNVRRCSL